LRLNGFLTIENFLLHRMRGGGNETDADVLGVRFPHRQEMVLDDPRGHMADHEALGLSTSVIDFVIAEVKTSQCALNGPWTRPERRNIVRLLRAIGPLHGAHVDQAADALYATGVCVMQQSLRIRLLAIGSDRSEALTRTFPEVVQMTWEGLLTFMHGRFQRYRDQKSDVGQWADDGKELQRVATRTRDRDTFVREVQRRMGVPEPRAPMHTRPAFPMSQ
jgi:hypothetical protein